MPYAQSADRSLTVRFAAMFKRVSPRTAFIVASCIVACTALAMQLGTRLVTSNSTVTVTRATLKTNGKSPQLVAERNQPLLRFADRSGKALKYLGDAHAVQVLQGRQGQARSLATGDFDLDGAPDLVAGFAAGSGGILSIQMGNPEAFVPKDLTTYDRAAKGILPPSLQDTAYAIDLPESPDSLFAEDFNEDGRKDVLVATRGGGLYLLINDGHGQFGGAERLDVPGQVTAVAVGAFGYSQGWRAVIAGFVGGQGPGLALFSLSTSGLSRQPMIMTLSSSPTSLALGAFDNDPYSDLAVATGKQIVVIHGQKPAAPVSDGEAINLEARMEQVDLGFAVRGLAAGIFVPGAVPRNDLAALGSDGVVHILQRTKVSAASAVDTNQWPGLSAYETRDAVRKRMLEQIKASALVPMWQPGETQDWVEAQQLNAGVAATSDVATILSAAKLSGQRTDDLMVANAVNQRVQILVPAPANSNDLGWSRSPVESTESAPATVLPMPQKINGERDLISLSSGGAPVVTGIVPLASVNLTVNNVTDQIRNSGNLSLNCVGNPGDCSLREAVLKANLNAGPNTINVPGNLGTYNLSVNNPNSVATTGTMAFPDLEIGSATNVNTTLVGISGTPHIHQTIANNDVITTGFTTLPFPANAAIVNLSLQNLEITGGTFTGIFTGADASNGAGDESNTTVTNCNVHNNSNADATFGQGGAHQNLCGTLSIQSTTYATNSATNAVRGQGGAVFYSMQNASGQCSVGDLTVNNSTFSSNTASVQTGFPAGGGLIALFASSGTAVPVTNTTFSGNQANGGGDGGALAWSTSTRTMNVTTSTFTSNQVSHASGHGGAVDGNAGTLNVNFNRFISNNATTTQNGKALFRNGGNFNANDNWWGINTGPDQSCGAGNPCDVNNSGGAGALTLTRWLQLRNVISGSPHPAGNQIAPFNGSTATFSADIRGLSDGGVTNASNLTGLATFPAASSTIYTNSSPALGGIAPTSGQYVNGVANISTVFTSNGTKGIATVNALADSETKATQLLIGFTPVFVNSGGSDSTPFASVACGGGASVPCYATMGAAITNVALTDLSLVAGVINIQGTTYAESPNFNQGSTVNINATFSNTGSFTFTNGVVNANANTISLTGNWTNNGSTFNQGSSTVNFNGTGAQNINGSVASQTFNNLTTNKGSGTLTVGGSTTTLNINGTNTLTAGTFDAGTAIAINVGGNWTNNGGTFTPGSGTVTFNSSAAGQSINGTAATQTFNNITSNKSGQTLSVGGSTTTLNLNTLTLSAGTFSAGTATGINLTGNWTNNSSAAAFTAGSSTVTFNGSSTQAIGGTFATTFNNLTANNSSGGLSNSLSGLTVTGLMRVQGGTFTTASTFNNVQIDSGATLIANAASTINVSGNWVNNGTFTPSTGTVNFNGGAAQAVSGSTNTTFNNLTVNNANGVSLSNGSSDPDASVAGVLTLTTDLSVAAGAVLQQSGTSAGAADVLGVVRRTDLGATERSFGNVNNSIQINSGTAPTQMDFTLAKIVPPTFPASSKVVARDITLTPTGGSGISATVKLRYIDPGELAGLTEANLILWKNISSIWTPQGGTVNTGSNFVSLSGVSSFSEWAIAEAPDLTLAKANNVGGSAVTGQAWNWTLTATNTGNPVTFTSGQVILSDNLPNSNVNYGTPTPQNFSNITGSGNISCSIVSNDLTCSASGGNVTFASNVGVSKFDVVFSATPQAAGSYQNPRTGGGVAQVDPNNNIVESNEGNNSPTTNTVTVSKANTTITISNAATLTSTASLVGEPVTVSWNVAVTGPGAAGAALTGNVTVSDGTNQCVADVSAGQCNVTFTSPGSKNITATYAGDTNYNASPPSAAAPHTVNKANTTTTITEDNPDPSTPAQSVTVKWTFGVNAPGAGTPTGNVTVTVSGGAETCNAAASAGQCSLVLNTGGARVITANYPGDSNFNNSSDTENHVVCGNPQIVTSIADSGPGSLRQALLDVCDGGSITFDTAGVFATPQTITLTTGELVVNTNVTIDGPDASHVTIDGGAASRVFHISAGKNVTIRELTVQNGNAAGNGGGLWNDHGTLTVLNSDVTTNTTTSVGGGIYNDATGGGTATLYVVNTTLRANTAFEGGALYNYATAGGVAQMYVLNCTLSGNNATGSGGGISGLETGGSATATINSSTITGNRADNDNDNSGTGGGIFFNAATFTLRSTIVAGNLNENGGSDSPDDINGGAVSAGSSNNLIGDAATAGGLSNGVNGNIVGNAGAGTIDINTVLNTTLANNGGPTLTHKLVTGSPAIDKAGDLTTLNGAIDNVVTSITVTDASSIPGNVGFIIQIESEQMRVDAKVGNVLTVARGANATTAAPHNNGVAVNPAFDQRGNPRIGDDPNITNAASGVDIGAYEALASPSTPNLDAASDSGPSNTDNYTSDNTPTFTINGVSNGATVDLLANGNPVASGVAAGTSIQLTSSVLSDATYSFAARQTVGGDTSPNSPGLSVTIDTVTPGTPTIDLQAGSDSGSSNSDDKTNATTRTFDIGNTEAGATVELLRDGNPITSVVSGGGTIQLSDSTAFVSGTTYAYTARQTDQAGNNATSGAVNVLIDSTVPTVTSIVRANANPTSATTVNFTVTFSEDVTGVGTSDFALTTTGSISGAFISTATVGTNVYTLTVNTGTGSGTIRLDLIDNGSIADIAGNELGGAGAQNFTTGEVYDIDKSAPTADITDVTPDPRSTAVSSITIVFSQAVTGFDLSDLSLTRNGGANLLTGAQTLTTGDNITWTLGNLSGLTGTSGNYLLTLTAAGSGIVDNVNNSLAGNATDAWVMDITAPTVTINQAAGQSDPAGGAAGIDFTVVFSEPVTGFTTAGVNFSGAGSTTATVTQIAPNDGTTYNVQISGMSVAGVVTASINANAAQDAVGNLSAASTSTDNQVTYTPCSLSPVVTTNADSGAGSLRQAILDACDGATITFSGVVSPITLTTGQLVINKNLTIQGPTASGLTISGNSSSRVFDITSSNVNISNLTVANGLVAAGDGGGLRNASADTVTLIGMTFTANQAVNGGAIATSAGAVNISNSTISGNTATTEGGGLYVTGGTVTLLNDTITNNTATGGQAGGLRRTAGTVDVRNTIIAGNTAPVNPNVVGAINDLGNNILSGNPLLAALANNGGPTMTHALLAGSPALDAGDNTAAASLTTDQRGFGRLRDAASDADTTQTVDIGAFEADPSIEDISNKATSEDTPLNFSFRVGDSFSAFDSITATSSNLTLVPNANLGITGSGATRNLNINPAANQSGTSTITVSITKTTSGTPVTMSDTFVLTVTSVVDTPSVTNTTTNEDTQSSGGLVITKNAADGAEVTYFKITNITGGTLFKNDGVTPIANNSFINLAEGGAGLRFTPTPNSVVTGTFQVQASTDAVGTQLSSGAATASIFITPIADTPSVTNATTNEDQQSLSGLVINRNAVDGAEVGYFKITGITGGTLYKTDTVTVINNGDFITIGEGNTGLRFTPAPNTHSPGTFEFKVQGATSNAGAGLSGFATATITVNPIADTPSATNATTNEDIQTTSGLVLSRNAADGAETSHFKITNITNGTLFKNNGTTVINNNDFITFAEGNAGLRFTPAANLFSPGTTFSFQVQAAEDALGTGISSAVTPTITVNSSNDAPSFTKGADQTVAENAGAQTVNNWATALSKGPANESGQTLSFLITNNTNPGLFQTLPAVSSTGTLTYNPAPNVSGTAAITLVIKDDGGTANGGVDTSAPQTFNITVNDAGVVQLSSATYSVTENNGPAVITINRIGGSAGTVEVYVNTSNGTATLADYTPLTNQLVTFNNGETTKTVNIPITNDLFNEPDVTVNVTITNVSWNTVLGSPTSAVLTIVNDDPVGGYLKFSSSNYTVFEGGVATITVQRVGSLNGQVTVDVNTADNSNPPMEVPCAPTPGNTLATSRCDYTSAFGRITFAAGDGADKTFTVLIDQDNYVEGPETVSMNLASATGGAALATPSFATLTIEDDTMEPAASPVDDTATFVEQLYRDFLNRPSDPAGKAFWVDNIDKCLDPARRLPGQTQAQCYEVQRINTAASFFLSIEFQATGGTAYLANKVSFNARPNFLIFERDAQLLGKGYVFGQPGAEAILEANKVAYFNAFVVRPAFTPIYGSLTNAQYVDALIANTGVSFTPAERDALVNGLNAATETRATVLRKITEKDTFKAIESNPMFVHMEYIGFLRRNPDTAGFDFWLAKLNAANGDYIAAEMIKAFITSIEYRGRFGP